MEPCIADAWKNETMANITSLVCIAKTKSYLHKKLFIK